MGNSDTLNDSLDGVISNEDYQSFLGLIMEDPSDPRDPVFQYNGRVYSVRSEVNCDGNGNIIYSYGIIIQNNTSWDYVLGFNSFFKLPKDGGSLPTFSRVGGNVHDPLSWLIAFINGAKRVK